MLPIGKNGDGKIVFLESGDARAGIQHVMNHADQFADLGVPSERVGQFAFDALTTGKAVGYQGKGRRPADLRIHVRGQTF